MQLSELYIFFIKIVNLNILRNSKNTIKKKYVLMFYKNY